MALLAAVSALAGCGIPLDPTVGQTPVNTCNSAQDCATGAACVVGKCAATSYDLTGLLLQVRLHADATFGAGTSYVIDPAAAGVQLASQGSGAPPLASPLSVKLTPPVHVAGQISLDASTVLDPGCGFPASAAPARLTFYRIPRLAGLPFDPVQATTTNPMGAPYSFGIDLVAGSDDRYDVYIEPQAPADCATALPPVFVPSLAVGSNTVWQRLPPVTTLTGTIAGLTDVDAWQVDVVEPTRGLPVSTGGKLQQASKWNRADELASAVVTAQISLPDPTQGILRLTPVDPSRPTIYWALVGALVAGAKNAPVVHFSVEEALGTAVKVKGTILDADGLTAVPSRVTIQSETLQGVNASNAAYSTSSDPSDPMNAGGGFDVELPPGNYWVRAFPIADNGLSITDHVLQWPTNAPPLNCLCGETFKLNGKASLGGTIFTPTGQPLVASIVGVNPSQVPMHSYLADTHTLPPLPARVESTMTDGTGSFSLLVDLGTSDLVVQPDPATNLPWLVEPQISPDPTAAPTMLTLTTPAFLRGTVVDPQEMPVANAEIDAWFPVRSPTDPSVLTGTVVKIATTSTDANGVYTLVLPSSI